MSVKQGSFMWAAINSARGYAVRRECFHENYLVFSINDLLENFASDEDMAAMDWSVEKVTIVHQDKAPQSIHPCVNGEYRHKMNLRGECEDCFWRLAEQALNPNKAK